MIITWTSGGENKMRYDNCLDEEKLTSGKTAYFTSANDKSLNRNIEEGENG